MSQHSGGFESNRARKLELPLYAAMSAKILCSAVFVSGRDPEEALQNSVLAPLRTRPGFQGQPEKVFSKIVTDWDAKAVHITVKDGPTRTARHYGDQGCIILPQDSSGVFFRPIKVETTLPDPMTQDWPMGDTQPDEPIPPEVDEEKLKGAVDAAFADPEAYTAAFLVVYKGRIIAERYGQGVDKDTQLECWSMGKSITSTLVGLLVQERPPICDPADHCAHRSPPHLTWIRFVEADYLITGFDQFTEWRDLRGNPHFILGFPGSLDPKNLPSPLLHAVEVRPNFVNHAHVTVGFWLFRFVIRNFWCQRFPVGRGRARRHSQEL